MHDDVLLRCASIACGQHSALLGRWLLAAGTPSRLTQHDACTCARVPTEKRDTFVQLLKTAGSTPHHLGDWQMISILDARYPALLKNISDPPGVLYVRGNVDALSMPQIAIVGSRSASTDGLDNAFRFARLLASAGFAVTSGLALGIDSQAHKGALAQPNNNVGITVAVLGHGPDTLYPKRNSPLADDIVQQGGALVTEFPFGQGPRRESFPARNRIISGMSLGIVVIEAAIRSGSLITARLAAQQGREVFAVPGSIHNPLAKGCHQLLRDGANWLESIDDILATFSSMQHTASSIDASTADSLFTAKQVHHPLLKHFISGINTVDQLVLRSGESAASLSQTLFELELNGAIERLPGGYSRRHL
ncbi:MAG: DNA-processing protein DprA [Alcanivoracaceae bacterium]|nr:DNA-processing protein DprA [Alcanivoracaceae bacterium]